MTFSTLGRFVAAVALVLTTTYSASAQVVEAVGTRALGMGGAFVAVASDSSATWWNPAGLATGPFIDLAIAKASIEQVDPLTAARDGASWFAISAPMVGFSYYRLRLTDIRPFEPTAGQTEDREDRAAGVAVRSTSVSQVGATVLQTLLPGVHAGTTIKYVRGTVHTGSQASALPSTDLLDLGEDLEGGVAEGHFDLDVGVLATSGAWRVGVVGRNLLEPSFAGGVELSRQVRIGAALDFDQVSGPPLVIAVDVDAARYETVSGPRRVIAVGGERWLFERRLGVRGGARANTVGGKERSATAGVSVAPRAGMFVEGHVVRGGTPDERGWGAALRVSF